MREIKFRVWFEVEQKMDYDPCIDPVDTFINEQFAPHFGEVWMQYTGLKDRNGKEIFEGDIVTTDYPTVKNISDAWVVEFGHTGMYQLYLPDMHSFKESIHDLVYNKWKLEVIGNIYVNPELLEQSK